MSTCHPHTGRFQEEKQGANCFLNDLGRYKNVTKGHYKKSRRDEPGISSRIVSAYALRPIMNLDDDWLILEYIHSHHLFCHNP